jgi:hypothetical protein
VLVGEVNKRVTAQDQIGVRHLVNGEVKHTERPVPSAVPSGIGIDQVVDDVTALVADPVQVDIPHPVEIPARGVKHRPDAKLADEPAEFGGHVPHPGPLRALPRQGLIRSPSVGSVDRREDGVEIGTNVQALNVDVPALLHIVGRLPLVVDEQRPLSQAQSQDA